MSRLMVLCGSNSYEQKYYFNPMFQKLPSQIQDELKIMCVLFTEEIGGVFTVAFTDDGTCVMQTQSDQDDILYDEIGCELKIKQLQNTKRELFEQLERFYEAFVK